MIDKKIVICINCKALLEYNDNCFSCSKCEANYKVRNNIPIFLCKKEDLDEKNSDDPDLRSKSFNIDLYNEYDKLFKESGVSKYIRFMNLGYIPNENVQHSNIDITNVRLNKASINLLLETIGGLNLDNKKIIEVGCGRGGNIFAIMNYFKPSKILAIDISFDNVTFAKSINTNKSISFCVADAEKLPIANNMFDVLINIESSYAYPNRNTFLSEVSRVLVPGGSFLWADILTSQEFNTSEDFLIKNGFEIIRNQDITSNVLLSASNQYSSKLKLIKESSIISNDKETLNMAVIPGSESYNDLVSEKKYYRIVHALKKIQ